MSLEELAVAFVSRQAVVLSKRFAVRLLKSRQGSVERLSWTNSLALKFNSNIVNTRVNRLFLSTEKFLMAYSTELHKGTGFTRAGQLFAVDTSCLLHNHRDIVKEPS
jgi:hypothetical protein